MKSILLSVNDPALRLDFLSRFLPEVIKNLNGHTAPKWGQMTAQHMVEHLVWAFELSTGKVVVTCETPENSREGMKAWLYNDRPSPRGFKNPKLPEAPGDLRYSSMVEAKYALGTALDEFIGCTNANSGEKNTHPLFGALGTDEWERVHFKHACHHLLQFGLIEEA